MKMKEAPDQLVMFVICIGLATLLAFGFVQMNKANAHETGEPHIHLSPHDPNWEERRRAAIRHNGKIRRECARKYWETSLKMYGDCVAKNSVRISRPPRSPEEKCKNSHPIEACLQRLRR